MQDGSRMDVWSSGALVLGYAIPGFLFAVLLIVVFAGGSFFQWFPSRGLTSEGFADFSMMGKGGASLAPFHNTESKLPAELVAAVKAKEAEILAGTFRVDIDEAQPAATN
jgi:ABC-type dipeptide/oligopeptide/nickel transport system permease component